MRELLEINNCNNIINGKIGITKNKLNIKYAINGTGKSTIAKSLEAFIDKDDAKKRQLLPFKYGGKFEGNEPILEGYDIFKSVMVFDENYVNNYVFQKDEIIKNSFEIFVKTDDYERIEREIGELLDVLKTTFLEHPELDELIEVYSSFINSFGKSKTGFSAAGPLAKGIGIGNKIDNIPVGLEEYRIYLKNENNLKWIKWQIDGKNYLDLAEKCPYCSQKVKEDTKRTILKVSEEYDANYIKHLNYLLDIFEKLSPYFSDDTAKNVKEISENVSELNKEQKEYLIEIKEQVQSLLSQLINLKNIGFHSLKSSEKISDELNKYKIDLTYYSHLNSEQSKEKVNIINSSLNQLLEKAGKLQGNINIQKKNIRKTIELYKNEINDFLYYAGYNYEVDIKYDNNINYRLLLKHIDFSGDIFEAENHLSYGEKNAFALVLFMYDSLRRNPELIILDDPISSFDGNKKFAIINMLFMGRNCLKNRTVLLLTHEFGTIIDCIKNIKNKLSIQPEAYFLKTINGQLSEQEIKESDIKSFVDIAKSTFESDINSLNKLIYFRRLEEIRGNKGDAYQLCSNIFHKRDIPIYKDPSLPDRDMDAKEIEEGSYKISELIHNFNYYDEIEKVKNNDYLIQLYEESISNYEKIQIYRIIFNENNSNDVIRKFVNEVFHIENDYIYINWIPENMIRCQTI